jgi:hypothetical protein
MRGTEEQTTARGTENTGFVPVPLAVVCSSVPMLFWIPYEHDTSSGKRIGTQRNRATEKSFISVPLLLCVNPNLFPDSA